MELPFLVVYGAVVWKVLLGLLVALVLVARLGLRVRRARRLARQDLAMRRHGIGTLAPGLVTIRGKLAKGSAATLVQGGELTDHRSDQLWLDQEGTRVVIDGPLRVDHGTQTLTWFFRPARGIPEPLAKAARPRLASTLRTVGEGDEVLVSGRLAHEASGDVTYRESAAQWTLTPDTKGAWIAAATPAVRAEPLHPARWIVTAAVAAVSSYLLLHAVGHHASKRAEKQGADIRELGNWHPASIAAAMPRSRDKALRHLYWRVDQWSPRTESWFQLGRELAAVVGECPLSKSTRMVRLDEALATARRCGSGSDVATQLAFLGRYDEIAPGDIAHDEILTTTVAIATGRWMDAAPGADALATAALERQRSEYYSETEAQQVALGHRCLGALFRSWGSQADQFAKIAGHDTNAKCRVLAALTLPLDQQAAALEAIAPDTFTLRDYRSKMFAEAVRIAMGGTMPEGARELSDTSLGFGDRGTMWLAPFAVTAHSTPLTMSRRHGQLAALATYRGDFATAKRELAAARALASVQSESLELAIALREGTPAPTLPPGTEIHPVLEKPHAMRVGKSIGKDPFVSAYPDDCEAQLFAAFDAASAGDGEPLAKVFESCRVSWHTVPEYLIAVLPRVTKNRERLAEALRLFRDDLSTFNAINLPFEFLDDITMYRDLARLAGDREDAAHWQQIFDRHAKVLADRQKVIALLFWTDRY
jgi:hypothetical protein